MSSSWVGLLLAFLLLLAVPPVAAEEPAQQCETESCAQEQCTEGEEACPEEECTDCGGPSYEDLTTPPTVSFGANARAPERMAQPEAAAQGSVSVEHGLLGSRSVAVDASLVCMPVTFSLGPPQMTLFPNVLGFAHWNGKCTNTTVKGPA